MVRSFLDDPVDETVLATALRQSLSGPSAGNVQSLQLVVLRNEAVTSYWDTTLTVERREVFPWPGLLQAPVLVLPYVEADRYEERYREPDKAHTGLGAPDSALAIYPWVDGGAAVQTLLLAAVAVGLGACFFGQFEHEPALRSRFGVPESMRALGTVAIGYEDRSTRRVSSSAKRGRRPFEETVHWNAW